MEGQLNLISEQREKHEIAPDAWLIPDGLDLDGQQELLEWLKFWCKDGFTTPHLPFGDRLPPSVPKREMPTVAVRLHSRSGRCLQAPPLSDLVRPRSDTAIFNWYSPEAKLGMHQDKSEDDRLLQCGSPIVTMTWVIPAHFTWATARARTSLAPISKRDRVTCSLWVARLAWPTTA